MFRATHIVDQEDDPSEDPDLIDEDDPDPDADLDDDPEDIDETGSER
jgi:hypothetical protein